MIEYCKYRAKLTKLFRQKESLRAAFAEDIRKAQKGGKPRLEIESIESHAQSEEWWIDEEISLLVTDNLIERASRRFVPIPSHDANEMWERCSTISNRYVLTNQGISQFRSSLRKDRKEQVEFVVMVLAVLTGIIGAVTGLVAVILR